MSQVEKADVQVKGYVTRSQKRVLFGKLFDREMTFSEWLRNQILKI